MASIKNSKRNTFIIGTDDSYNIYNTGAYTTISLSTGNNTVDNSGSHVTISTGSGDDSIYNRTRNAVKNSYVTISAGEGSDTVISRSSRSYISGDDGDDIISITGGTYVTIEGGEGSDTIVTSAQRASIDGGDGDDLIIIKGVGSTVSAGLGNDSIKASSYADTFIYNIGDGDDTITNYGNTDAIKINLKTRSHVIKRGNKKVRETYSSYLPDDLSTIKKNISIVDNSLVINVGTGSLTIKNALNKKIKLIDDFKNIIKINPSDYVNNNIDSDTIVGTSGNDLIKNGYEPGFNTGSNVTILAGAGRDTIQNKGTDVYIDAGEGNDKVNNYGSGTTIFGASGKDTIRTKGTSVVVDGGEDSDYIYNNTNSSLSYLNGGLGSDTIRNYSAYVIVDGSEDNDFLYNGTKGKYSTLIGGEGNDKIRNANANSVWIEGGAGDDSIYSTGSNVTITAGAGNDTIRLGVGNNLINYSKGDGADTIYGYKTSDTINLNGLKVLRRAMRNGDILLMVNEEGKDTVDAGLLTIKNVRNRKITIAESIDSVTSEPYDKSSEAGLELSTTRTTLKVTPPFEGLLDLNDYYDFRDVKDIDARDSDSAIAVISNNRGNRLYTSSAGGTLYGGTANDYLYGNEGADSFVYANGGGNDVFYNYEPEQDTIELESDVSVNRVAVLGQNVVLYFEGGGSLKIQNGKGKALSITESGTTSTYTFTTSNNSGDGLSMTASSDTTTTSTTDDTNTNTADFEEREYKELPGEFALDVFVRSDELDEIIFKANDVMKGDINGEQSICIPGATCERQGLNGVSVDEHGSTLHSDLHNKVF